MTKHRTREGNIRITCDFLTGKSAQELADANEISIQRVYQIVNTVIQRVKGFEWNWQTLQSLEKRQPGEIGIFLNRLRMILDGPPPHVEAGTASTPEGFYWELYAERNRDNAAALERHMTAKGKY